MRQIQIFLALVVIIVVFSGCGVGSVVVMDSYKNQNLTAKTLGIHVDPPVILNPDDVIDDLGAGVADEVYMNYFSTQFIKEIKSFGRIDSVTILRPSAMGWLLPIEQVPINAKENILIAIPEKGASFPPDSVRPDYALLISKYTISRGSPTSGTWTPGPPGTPSTYSGGSMGDLTQQLQFALWDNTQGKLVSYGRVEAKSSIMLFSMTKGNWNDCLRSLARDIMKASPFFHMKNNR